MTAEASAAPVQRNANTIPKVFVEKSAERPVSTEQQQQQVTGHDGRHHERQMDHAVEQALAPKSAPRQNELPLPAPKGRLPSIAQNATRRLSRTASISSALKSEHHVRHRGRIGSDHFVYSSETAMQVRQDMAPTAAGRGRLRAVGPLNEVTVMKVRIEYCVP